MKKGVKTLIIALSCAAVVTSCKKDDVQPNPTPTPTPPPTGEDPVTPPPTGIQPSDIKIVFSENVQTMPEFGFDGLVYCPGEMITVQTTEMDFESITYYFKHYGTDQAPVQYMADANGMIHESGSEFGAGWMSAIVTKNNIQYATDTLYVDQIVLEANLVSHRQHPAVWMNAEEEEYRVSVLTAEHGAPEEYVTHQWGNTSDGVRFNELIGETDHTLTLDENSQESMYDLRYTNVVCPNYEMYVGASLIIEVIETVVPEITINGNTIEISNAAYLDYPGYEILDGNGNVVSYNTNTTSQVLTPGNYTLVTHFWGSLEEQSTHMSLEHRTHITEEVTFTIE